MWRVGEGVRRPEIPLQFGTVTELLAGARAVLAARLTDPDALARTVSEHLAREIDRYQDPALSPADLLQVCRTEISAVLSQLDDDGQFDTSLARRHGAERAAADFPLSSIMEAYRIGMHLIWQALTEASAGGGVTSAELVTLADRLWQAQDQFTQAMADGYRERATELLLTQEAERAAVVEALLEGRTLSQNRTWDAATQLRLPRRGPFTVVVADVRTPGTHAIAGVEARLAAVDLHSAWRLRPDIQVGIVSLPATGAARLTEVLSRYPGARLGVSPVYPALEGTGAALRLARIAMTAAARGGELVVFDDQPLLVAAVADPDVMRRVVAAVLAPLDSMRPEDRTTLLDTLAAWLDNAGSAEATGRALYCHPNTVRQRLRRLESRTGRSLADPRQLTELCLALEAERRLAGSDDSPPR